MVIGKVYLFVNNNDYLYRHFFQSTFTRGAPILILVDSEQKYLDNDIRMHLGDARGFYFGKAFVCFLNGIILGGLPIQVVDKPRPTKFQLVESTINHSVINRYRGCMSSMFLWNPY